MTQIGGNELAPLVRRHPMSGQMVDRRPGHTLNNKHAAHAVITKLENYTQTLIIFLFFHCIAQLSMSSINRVYSVREKKKPILHNRPTSIDPTCLRVTSGRVS